MAAWRHLFAASIALGALVCTFAVGADARDSVRGIQSGIGPGVAEIVTVHWSVPGRRLDATWARAAIPDRLELTFESNGVHIHVHLQNNHVLMDRRATHVLHFLDGHTEAGPLPEPCFYVGDVDGDAQSTAAVSTCDGGVSGFVITNGQALTIEPTGRRRLSDAVGVDAALGTEKHYVRRLDDAVFAQLTRNVATFFSTRGQGRRMEAVGTKYIEALVVNDNSRVQSFGGQAGTQEMATQAVAVMNAVTAIYRRAPANGTEFPYIMQVVFVGMHSFLDSDPWDSTVDYVGTEVNTSNLLSLFADWSETQQLAGSVTASDNRILLSGLDFDGNTIGLAYMSVMCRVSMSANINMCQRNSSVGGCAAVVAHEMGHNLGMSHDSDGNGCTSSGYIMEAVADSDPSDTFSSCSVTYLEEFFNNEYQGNGACMENSPTAVFGDPVCANGFVEDGESCDCGASDCSSIDPCCNGTTCEFVNPSYQCSNILPCCEGCMFVNASANKTCRAAQNDCDIAEKCAGGTASCPDDRFSYPGAACNAYVQSTGTYHEGVCLDNTCTALEYTCAVDVGTTFAGDWDVGQCASLNDGCGTLYCHPQSGGANSCSSFTVDDHQMTVPEGTPCHLSGDADGDRNGMCNQGVCSQPFTHAEIPVCGNGGIDYGEECDCGGGEDPCCDCSTCTLASATYQCSSTEECCDSATCTFKSAGTMCRTSSGSCDAPEYCSGSSGSCPSDQGEPWGTACNYNELSLPNASTCFAGSCVKSLAVQCVETLGSSYPVPRVTPDGNLSSDSWTCTMHTCCAQCSVYTGRYSINGEIYDDPTVCSSCVYTNTNLDDGTTIHSGDICIDGDVGNNASACNATAYYKSDVGMCLPCDASCNSGCSGPTPMDCIGNCTFGVRDFRGVCPMSAVQAAYLPNTTEPTPAPTPGPPTPIMVSPTTVAPSVAPTPATPAPPTPASPTATSAPSAAPTPPTPAPPTAASPTATSAPSVAPTPATPAPPTPASPTATSAPSVAPTPATPAPPTPASPTATSAPSVAPTTATPAPPTPASPTATSAPSAAPTPPTPAPPTAASPTATSTPSVAPTLATPAPPTPASPNATSAPPVAPTPATPAPPTPASPTATSAPSVAPTPATPAPPTPASPSATSAPSVAPTPATPAPPTPASPTATSAPSAAPTPATPAPPTTASPTATSAPSVAPPTSSPTPPPTASTSAPTAKPTEGPTPAPTASCGELGWNDTKCASQQRGKAIPSAYGTDATTCCLSAACADLGWDATMCAAEGGGAPYDVAYGNDVHSCCQPAPTPPPTPAPTRRVPSVKTRAILELDVVTDFDSSAYVRSMAELTGVQTSAVAVVKVEFKIVATYQFPSGSSISEDDARSAIALLNNVLLVQVKITIRVIGTRRLGRRLSGETEIDAEISTEDAAAASAAKAASADAAQVAASFTQVTGTVVAEPTVAAAPSLEVAVETTVTAADGTSSAPVAPSAAALAQSYGGEIGKTMTVALEVTEQYEPPICSSSCGSDATSWRTKCDWTTCGNCKACTGQCPGWCVTNTYGWLTKCSWRMCDGCADCAADCSADCHNPIKQWWQKCTWVKCQGCSVCRLPRHKRPDYRKCEKHCQSIPGTWTAKCKLEACRGCARCSPKAAALLKSVSKQLAAGRRRSSRRLEEDAEDPGLQEWTSTNATSVTSLTFV